MPRSACDGNFRGSAPSAPQRYSPFLTSGALDQTWPRARELSRNEGCKRVKDPFHAEIKAMCTFRVEQKAARFEQVQSH